MLGRFGRRRDSPGVLIIVQNLSVPRDRRVWLEAQALSEAGFAVSVICPRADGEPAREVLDGVRIWRYSPPPPARGAGSYIWEFAYCWARTAALALRAVRREGFDVIQACNPPDTYWALALPFKALGKRFVFDQHDLCPEVYEARFGGGSPIFRVGLRLLERASYAVADHVIVTNESYREVAQRRGAVPADRVTVVRTGPDESRLRKVEPARRWRRGRPYMCAYLGVMGPQDGVDLALRAAAKLVAARGDVHFVFMGSGDSLEELRALAAELAIQEFVTFTGWADDETILEVLSTADLGLSPDPLTPFSDVSTMNKTMEYMAMELPVVAFDLKETRVSAGGAAVYVPPNDVEAFACAVSDLLDDPERRARMGRVGRRRVENELSWRYQAPRYVAVMERLVGARSARRG